MAVDADTDVVYHRSRFPLRVMQDRDVVIWRHMLERDERRGLFTLVWSSCDHPRFPPADGAIRIRTRGSYRILQRDEDVHVYSLVMSDIGGVAPMALVRASSVPVLLSFRSRIAAACRDPSLEDP